MLVKFQSAVSLITCGCLVSLAASPSSIGIVVTNGQAIVDGTTVQRNSTLFQGSLVQAQEVSSDLLLPGGSNLLLGAGSAANVFHDYAILRQGTVTARGGHGYAVFADGLRISSPQGAVTIGLENRTRLAISAQGSAAEVRNPAGMLLARVDAGRALNFAVQEAPQAPPAAVTSPAQAAPAAAPEAGQQITVRGIVRKDHAGRYGHYLLTDVASKISFELQGSELDDLVGGSVEVNGTILSTAPAEGAARVLSVSDIRQMSMSDITGSAPEPEEVPAAPATPSSTAAAPPIPTGDATPAGPGPTAAGPQPPPEEPVEASAPEPPPLPVHSDTAKILLIVGLAAGAGIGAALGLAGGKTSTVSPE